MPFAISVTIAHFLFFMILLQNKAIILEFNEQTMSVTRRGVFRPQKPVVFSGHWNIFHWFYIYIDIYIESMKCPGVHYLWNGHVGQLITNRLHFLFHFLDLWAHFFNRFPILRQLQRFQTLLQIKINPFFFCSMTLNHFVRKSTCCLHCLTSANAIAL